MPSKIQSVNYLPKGTSRESWIVMTVSQVYSLFLFFLNLKKKISFVVCFKQTKESTGTIPQGLAWLTPACFHEYQANTKLHWKKDQVPNAEIQTGQTFREHPDKLVNHSDYLWCCAVKSPDTSRVLCSALCAALNGSFWRFDCRCRLGFQFIVWRCVVCYWHDVDSWNARKDNQFHVTQKRI